MVFFNLEQFCKISALKMRQDDRKRSDDVCSHCWSEYEQTSQSVLRFGVNKRFDCILHCLYTTRECVHHRSLTKLAKVEKYLFLLFAHVFNLYPFSKSGLPAIPIDRKTTAVVWTSFLFYWLKRIRVSHWRESLTDSKSVQKSIRGHLQPEQPSDSFILWGCCEPLSDSFVRTSAS